MKAKLNRILNFLENLMWLQFIYLLVMSAYLILNIQSLDSLQIIVILLSIAIVASFLLALAFIYKIALDKL